MIRKFLFTCVAATLAGVAVAGVLLVNWARHLDAVVVEKFSGRRWDFPSKIYGDVTPLYPGVGVDTIGLSARLNRLGYRDSGGPVEHPGEFHRGSGSLDIFLRQFDSPTGQQPARSVRLTLGKAAITQMADLESGVEIFSLDLEPEVLAGLHHDIWEERRVLSLEQVPATLVSAILSTEDQRFFEHGGIDPQGIARALWVNLTSGRVVQGGSTLTQQLMKNFFLTEERSLERKLREAVMAVVAERRYTKRQILENYLNEIYLGQNGSQGIYGVWEAARFYFRKEPRALSLPECALIAGILTGPNYYSPVRHPDRARQRRDNVLRLMHERGLISQGELDEALAAPLGVVDNAAGGKAAAPYFVDYMRQELEADYGGEALAREGLSIFTGLDPEMQLAAEEALAAGLADLERRYPRLARGEGRLQGCLVALHPQTGEIKAMVGGRDYQQSQFNRCAQALRQPGSVFKPFTYIAALDHPPGIAGITPVSTLDDSPFTWQFEGRAWTPGNYGDQYRGVVSVREALELSLNAATARLAEQTGLERVRDTAHRMGIRSELPLYPSLVLGAVEVTPLEVAEAYAVLANQGLRATPLAVRTVRDHGGALMERKPMEVERAIPAEIAYLVTHLLEGVLDHGTGTGARDRGFHRHAAGKTGTTNDARDAWFAGYTAALTAVVWVGFDDNRPLALSGSQAALPLWTDFMKRAVAGQPDRAFLPPVGVTVVVIDPLTGARATSACQVRLEEAFLSGDEPEQPCPLHPEAGVSPGTGQSDKGARQPL